MQELGGCHSSRAGPERQLLAFSTLCDGKHPAPCPSQSERARRPSATKQQGAPAVAVNVDHNLGGPAVTAVKGGRRAQRAGQAEAHAAKAARGDPPPRLPLLVELRWMEQAIRQRVCSGKESEQLRGWCEAAAAPASCRTAVRAWRGGKAIDLNLPARVAGRAEDAQGTAREAGTAGRPKLRLNFATGGVCSGKAS